MNPYWILLENNSTVHMSGNRALLLNIQDADDPIDVYSSGGATHCSTDGNLNNIGEVYLHENGSENILSYAKIKDKHNITYDYVGGIFTVHTPYKRIHFRKNKRGLYYHNCKPEGKKRDVAFVRTFEENKEGFTNREIRDTEKARSAYNMVGRPSAAYFERMVRGNALKNCPVSVNNIKNAHTIFGPDIGSLRGRIV